jgi:hypothetical protein
VSARSPPPPPSLILSPPLPTSSPLILSLSLSPAGPYTGTTVSWNKGLMVTTFYVYNQLNTSLSTNGAGANAAVVFEQSFPLGVTGTQNPDKKG